MAKSIADRTFDARPDRVDLRDREYRPPLRNLPGLYPSEELIERFLPAYTKSLILDQGNEGACTGFGLAAVINYLLWKTELDKLAARSKAKKAALPEIKPVSPSMLYRMARAYDEWPGEDYEGSSCRGAMKGWHRHGVCSDEHWPFRTKSNQIRYLQPKSGWQEDATKRPLGAYYRINKNSVVDMQSAIYEVGAIYVSSDVHEGWDGIADNCKELPTIVEPQRPKDIGGHAFALVGYNDEGFIVQNSWGAKWGYYGFAVLTYSDWVRHGTDAWAAVMGAPVCIQASRTHTSLSLEQSAAGRATWFWRDRKLENRLPVDSKVRPWEESRAYEHTVVLENDGRPVNRFLDVRSAEDAVRVAAEKNPLSWLKSRPKPRLAIYAHGGLNDEEASIARVRVLAPYFLANDIYPLFITWRTGFLESIHGILDDAVQKFFDLTQADLARGKILDEIANQVHEALDRSIEVASEKLLVKAVWTQMKQNAAAAAAPPPQPPSEVGPSLSATYRAVKPGLILLAEHLRALKASLPALEIHLVGHSAGSILLGYLLDLLVKPAVKITSLSLFAPACTVDFALQKFAGRSEILAPTAIHVDVMSDERELGDTVGPYKKSLLYLVSRALEDRHKTPILGMEKAWTVNDNTDPAGWPPDFQSTLRAWQKFHAGQVHLIPHGEEKVEVAKGESIPLAHGSFDNDINTISRTLRLIRSGEALAEPVIILAGF